MNHPRRTTRSRSARRIAPSRRGITLLEVILAVVLLGLTCASVMGAVSAILGMEAEGARRLEATEIANRLMLQYLDDEHALPPKALPITYGEHRYFWALDETPARMVINHKQEASGANLQAVDRFVLVGVTVFESNSAGAFETRGEPIAFLSRVIDPAAPRNADSIEALGKDINRIEELVRRAIGQHAAPTGLASMQGRQLR